MKKNVSPRKIWEVIIMWIIIYLLNAYFFNIMKIIMLLRYRL